MTANLPYEALQDGAEVLHSLAEVGAHLSNLADRRKALDLVLLEARRLTHAEAGSLYILHGDRLRFVAAQNDRIPLPEITRLLLDKEMPLSNDSLGGYAASTAQVLNIADADALRPDAPFRINRSLEAATGYRVRSVLAIPLKCFDGRVIGLLELFNRLDPRGRVVPFPGVERLGVLSLASMAALAVHNMLLQEELKQSHLDTIIRLSVVVEFRDTTTAHHIRRISFLSTHIARTLGLAPRDVELLECASPMHDIGKVAIPDAILQKPGRLSPQERRIIEQHPLIGAEILGDPRNDLLAKAREITLSHHERWDGRGYPHRLRGSEIPLSARIVGLADVFDALASRRPYKEAYALDQVVETVQEERGRHFDPVVVDALLGSPDPALDAYASEAALTVN